MKGRSQVLLISLALPLVIGQYESKTPPPPKSAEDEYAKPPGYAGTATSTECIYDEKIQFSDCDPFTLKKFRLRHLVSGPKHCENGKNETETCSVDEFPPGTQWLVKEHKKCISELEHLKSIINDLHRWIDLIAERGNTLHGTFQELRKHLEDLQKQIKVMHRQAHDHSVVLERLTKELEQWKEKARGFRSELDHIKAEYTQLQKEHEAMKVEQANCEKEADSCSKDASDLSQAAEKLDVENRELKGKLIDAERYKLMVEKAKAQLDQNLKDQGKLVADIDQVKKEIDQCHVDLLNAQNAEGPKVDKDTHVNLDMQMWITHNQTVKYQSTTYQPPTTTPYTLPPQRIYYEQSTPYYPPPTYKPSTYTTQPSTYTTQPSTYTTKPPTYTTQPPTYTTQPPTYTTQPPSTYETSAYQPSSSYAAKGY